jgi:hypothetical protein
VALKRSALPVLRRTSSVVFAHRISRRVSRYLYDLWVHIEDRAQFRDKTSTVADRIVDSEKWPQWLLCIIGLSVVIGLVFFNTKNSLLLKLSNIGFALFDFLGFSRASPFKGLGVAKVRFKKSPKTPPASQSRGGGFAERGRRRRSGARNCFPYCRTIGRFQSNPPLCADAGGPRCAVDRG